MKHIFSSLVLPLSCIKSRVKCSFKLSGKYNLAAVHYLEVADMDGNEDHQT